MKCPNCEQKLFPLYYREWNKKTKNSPYVKIEAKYCKSCKKPTVVQELNWFKE